MSGKVALRLPNTCHNAASPGESLLTGFVHMCGSDERIAYYNKHDIAYVARPPHGKDGFVRGGRFKKASNMNFCLTVSQQVSRFMQVSFSTPLASSLCKHKPAQGCADAFSIVKGLLVGRIVEMLNNRVTAGLYAVCHCCE